MACTLEKVLTDARTLLDRLKEHDAAAEGLIEQTGALGQRVQSMREVGNALPDKVGTSKHVSFNYTTQVLHFTMFTLIELIGALTLRDKCVFICFIYVSVFFNKKYIIVNQLNLLLVEKTPNIIHFLFWCWLILLEILVMFIM